jgi:lipopolysaccharide biosynthesis protein
MQADFRARMRDLTFRVLRAGFRAMPLGEATRDRLRGRFTDALPAIVPLAPQGQPARTSAHRAMVRADLPAIGAVARRDEPLPDPLPATLVAFYLPQFHPIPENDAWWGRGFTEWRNVARALPQFEGHAQPRLPGELGFYDLRNPQSLRDQADLAQAYGIGAFCFYFYWFQGRRLLDAPIEQWLADRSITMPFCLCWANESWSRRWDGRAGDILVAQSHDADDDLAFIAHVARFLRDPRYLRVEGKPLLLVYRPELMPDPAATATRWREWCAANGIGEITIACVQGFERPDPRDIGFDAAVEFPPNLCPATDVTARQHLLNPDYAGNVLDWRDLAAEYRSKPMPGYRLFPGVNCGWDNEPRQPGRGRTYLHASPRGFRDWLQDTIQSRLAQVPASDRLVFVNAWNEWAEGAVLEPDARLDHAWLQATRDALRRAALPAPAPPARPCVVVHAWDATAFEEIVEALLASGLEYRWVVTTTTDRAGRMQEILERRGITAEIVVGPNRGRDILPFLHVANRLLDDGEDVVFKLHAMLPTSNSEADIHHRALASCLLAPDRAVVLQATLASQPRLGMIASECQMRPTSAAQEGHDGFADLGLRIGLPADLSASDRSPVGGALWVRLQALRPVLDGQLDEWAVEAAVDAVPGTHVIERLLRASVMASGYGTLDPARLDDVPRRDRGATTSC